MVYRTFLRLSPLALPFIVLFGGGLAMTAAQSVGLFSPVPMEGPWYSAYARLLSSHLLTSFWFSLYVALVSATLAVSIGSVLAWGIWKLPEKWQQTATVYKIPLILPHIAVAFIILLFWARSGIVASICHHLGLISSPADFPSILYGGNGLGMIFAYTLKETPFVVILALAVLRRLDPRLVQTARMFGSSETAIFLKIALPHMRAALHTAFIILFLFTFGAFDIPFLLGESKPGMLSIEIYNLYFKRELTDRPTAMAMLTIMLLCSAIFIVAYTRIASRLSDRERKL